MQAELAHLLDTLPAMVWTALPDGNIDFINRRWREFLGQGDGTGTWDWNASIHPDDLAAVGANWRSILRSGEEGEINARARRFDGEFEAVLMRCSPIHDEHGRIARWCAMVTKRNRGSCQREADLQVPGLSAENLQLTIDTIPAAVWSARPDGSADFFNQHYLDYIGLPLAEALGWGWTQAIHPDDLPGLSENWRFLTTSGQAGEAEARIRRFDGEYRWFLFRTTPHRDESGKVVKWYGLNTDIEDRKQMEGRLRRSEAFLAEGQHLARMGNLSWRIATGEIIWSEPLYRIFEFEPGTAVTLDRIAERVPPEDVPMMMDMIARAQRGEMEFEYQHRIMFPDGRVKHLHLIAHRTPDRDEVEYNGAVLDITQRRLSEETLEKVRSELAQVTRIMSLGALTASIAHEVNQPLSGIVTNAGTCLRMLSADPPNIEIAKETARRTIRDGNRAADIIARLRSLFARKVVAHQPVDLNEAAREVLALLAGDLHRSNVVLSTGFAVGLPRVGGDRIQLQQVIMNLATNAAQAMAFCGELSVSLAASNVDAERARTNPDLQVGPYAVLSVRDTGQGMDERTLSRIFEPFFTTKAPGEGTGLGLSLSYGIVKQLGGSIDLKSKVGEGTEVTIALPK